MNPFVPPDDPFAAGNITDIKWTGGKRPNWQAHINPIERQLLLDVANRVHAMLREHIKHNPRAYEILSPPVIAADFAVLHIDRPINFRSLHEADDLTLLQEYIKIARVINRPEARLNAPVDNFRFYGGILNSGLARIKKFL